MPGNVPETSGGSGKGFFGTLLDHIRGACLKSWLQIALEEFVYIFRCKVVHIVIPQFRIV